MTHDNTLSINPDDWDDTESPEADSGSNKRRKTKRKGKGAPTYNREDFIVPAGDDRGHSSSLQARCTPAYFRRIDVVIHSRKFPFKTKSDVLRWAIHIGLKKLEELEPEIELDMASIEVVNRIILEKKEKIEFMESSRKLTETVNDFLARGVPEEAIRTLRDVLAKLPDIEEGYWRKWYEQEIKRRFGYLFQEKDVREPRGSEEREN